MSPSPVNEARESSQLHEGTTNITTSVVAASASAVSLVTPSNANELRESSDTMPYQPSPSEIPPQELTTRTLTFQGQWFSTFPWLHYSTHLQSVVCCVCVKAHRLGLMSLASKSEPASCPLGSKIGRRPRKDSFVMRSPAHTTTLLANCSKLKQVAYLAICQSSSRNSNVMLN